MSLASLDERTTKRFPIAALVYSPDIDPAPVLAEVVQMLRERGVALAGAIEHNNSSCSMELELLSSGSRMGISQALGSGAAGCRLNGAALAEAASLVRRDIEAAPALAIFNKFGSQESAGGGLRDEMAQAAMAHIPVLTAVGERFLDQWSAFTGGDSVQLPCSAEAALAWWDALQKR